MGGLGSVLPAVAHAAAEEAPEVLAKTFKSLESGMRRTEAGNMVADLFKNTYLPKYHAVRQDLFNQALQSPKAQQMAPHEIDSQARNIARKHTLGSNDWLGVGLVKSIENQPGLTPLQMLQEQQNLADHMHMMLKDTVPNKVLKRYMGGKVSTGPVSQFKYNLNRSKENPVPVTIDAKYHLPTSMEKLATKWLNLTALPAILIPHIGTIVNMGLKSDMRDLIPALWQASTNKGGVKQAVADAGIFSGTVSHAYTARYYGSRGFMAKIGGDKFGELMYNITHQPGFNPMRDWQLAVGGATGKLASERMANQLIQSGGKDKVAIWQLRKMGLVPADIMAKGGLDPDMQARAIYNYVDQRLFLDNTMSRSFYSSANVFTRMGLMYHNYVTRQGRFILSALRDEVAGKGGPVAAAQALATLAIVYPTVGVGIKTLQMYGRGQFQEATPVKDFKRLSGQEGIGPMAEELLEGYSHMAAFGVATDYSRAMSRHMLANAAFGPVGNEAANIAQDSYAAVVNIGNDKEWERTKPLARDVVEDSLPDNLGKLITHQLLPTQKEERARHPKIHKLKSLGLKNLKKLN